MRRNRQTTKRMSVLATNSMRFGAIIVSFFLMVILNLLSSSNCTQLLKTQGELEKTLAELEKSCTRESSNWDKMKSAENVQSVLLRHGLSMRLPRPDQNVRMNANGVPKLGQYAVTRAQQRAGVATARATTVATPTIRNQYRRQGRR